MAVSIGRAESSSRQLVGFDGRRGVACWDRPFLACHRAHRPPRGTPKWESTEPHRLPSEPTSQHARKEGPATATA